MRILLAVTLVLSLAACGKKKAPQAPADNAATEAAPAEAADEEKSTTEPTESEDAAPMGADPEEGGE